jgi:hypothetical protein
MLNVNKLTYMPLPPDHDGATYFGVALANWAVNYSEGRRPLDCWYVVRVRMNSRNRSIVFDGMLASNQNIIGRYRHYTGRLYKHDETYPVVNALNNRPLSVLASSATPGGLARYIKEVSREMEVEDVGFTEKIERILKGDV